MKYYILFSLLLLSNGFSQTREINGTISGTLYSDTTYIVTDNLTVSSENTLTIQAGTRIQFTDSVNITINGTLTAIGAVNDSIFFTRNEVSDSWLGIRMMNANSSSRIEYCVIEYGYARPYGTSEVHYGGGIYCSNSSPSIKYNHILNCEAGRSGGAIGLYNGAHPLIEGNLIENNIAEQDPTRAGGGAILVLIGCSPTIRDNIIRNNRSKDLGGAIDINGYSAACNPIIEGNTFYNNEVTNVSGGYGGAISCVSGVSYTNHPVIRNNIIINNTAASWGGGLYFSSFSAPQVYNNIIVKNSALRGGGIALTGTVYTDSIYHNTVAHDTASQRGGGIYIHTTTVNANLKSNIFWGNESPSDPQIRNQAGVNVTVDTCVVDGGFTGNGNISADPHFTDSTNNDYSIKSNSSAIDAGSVLLYSIQDYSDYYRWVDGDSNGVGGPDIGAYEFMPAGQIISQTSQDYYYVVNGDSEAVFNFSSLENTDGVLSIYAYQNRYPHDKGSGKSVKRWYDIRSNGIGDFTAVQKLYYTDSEFAASGISDESGLEFYRNTGSNWAVFGGSVNTIDNYVSKNNVQSFSRFTFADANDSPLPVVLTSFRALQSDNSVLVEWISASEINNRGFALYRADKKRDVYQLLSDFTINSDLKGLGNSSSGKVYRFFDKNIKSNSTYYYRLYDVDISGFKREIGNTVISTNNILGNIIPQKFELYQNYPNPFNSTTTIIFDLPEKQNVKINIYNLLGEIVMPVIDVELEAGRHKYLIDCNQLSSGIYIYYVVTAENKSVNKMILMK